MVKSSAWLVIDINNPLLWEALFEVHCSEGSHGTSKGVTNGNDIVVGVGTELSAYNSERVGRYSVPTAAGKVISLW